MGGTGKAEISSEIRRASQFIQSVILRNARTLINIKIQRMFYMWEIKKKNNVCNLGQIREATSGQAIFLIDINELLHLEVTLPWRKLDS